MFCLQGRAELKANKEAELEKVALKEAKMLVLDRGQTEHLIKNKRRGLFCEPRNPKSKSVSAGIEHCRLSAGIKGRRSCIQIH